MKFILVGGLIEAAGFILFIVSTVKQGFPPSTWVLGPAIVLVVVGNGMVVLTVLSRAMAGKRSSSKGDD